MAKVFGEREVEDAIRFLDQCWRRTYCNWWVTVRLTELSLNDISVLKPRLKYLFDRPDSPAYKSGGLSDPDLRALALELRIAARAAENLPPLTQADLQEWQLVAPTYAPYQKRAGKIRGPIQIAPPVTDEHLNAAIAWIRQHHPEVLKLWSTFADYRRSCGDEEFEPSLSYLYSRFHEALEQVMPLYEGQQVRPTAAGEVALKLLNSESPAASAIRQSTG